ncbi:class F sortase [Georgenia faecalis]|uniref:class F sortase n=1 Tax=Georgenia faecalis TaxID=2483799 RepID=UPI000FDAF32A|nr:class F sortase [Georgenia faecalis]
MARRRPRVPGSEPRDALDPALFATDGDHRLVLITCGGAFDERSGQYAENIVVVAEPAA